MSNPVSSLCCCCYNLWSRSVDDDDDDDVIHRQAMFETEYIPNAYDVILDQLTPEEKSEFDIILSMGVFGTQEALRHFAESKMMRSEEDNQEEANRGLSLLKLLADHFHDSQAILKVARCYEAGCIVTKDEKLAWDYYGMIMRRRKNSRPRSQMSSAFQKWRELGGEELESCLESGAIRLLDAGWLVQHALESPSNIINRRQDLPEEAFLDLNDMVNACQIDDLDFSQRIQIICLSYMWLDSAHPDPQSWTFHSLVRRLKLLLKERISNSSQYNNTVVLGVFWDFASLHQRPRTETETTLFNEGLKALAVLYSHPMTFVYKVTKPPPGYPVGYSVDSDPQQRQHALVPYRERGWPFTESCWSVLTKRCDKTIDLSLAESRTEMIVEIMERIANDFLCDNEDKQHMRISEEEELYCTLFVEKFMGEAMAFLMANFPLTVWHRISHEIRELLASGSEGPVLPDMFDDTVNKCSFTNGNVDRYTVKQLYRRFFVRHFHEAKILSYGNMNWNDMQVIGFASIITQAFAPKVEVVDLGRNFITCIGCGALAKAFLARTTPKLVSLRLDYNLDMKDDGVHALSPAIPYIQNLSLSGIFMSGKGCRKIADVVLGETGSNHLKNLDVSMNPLIGDLGCVQLSRIAAMLEDINLSNCRISDTGCNAFIMKAINHASSTLRRIDLSNNPIGDEGFRHLIPLIEHCSSTLEYLDVSATLISDTFKVELRSVDFVGRNTNIFCSGLRV